MVFGILALLAIPVIGLLLWIIKKLLKLTMPVAKIVLIIFAVWFVFTAITGGLNDAFGNIGEPHITSEDGKTTYLVAFSDNTLDISEYVTSNYQEISVDCIISDLKLKVPDDCVVKLTVTGAVASVAGGEDKDTVWLGRKQLVIGSGSKIVEMRLNAAFVRLTIL